MGNLFPSEWIEDHIDSALCSGLGGAVDMLLGKELVRTILKKDWDSKGGAKGFMSVCANVYAVALTVIGAIHIIYVLIEKPQLQLKLVTKLIITLIMKLAFMETLILTVKTYMASRSAQGKGKTA